MGSDEDRGRSRRLGADDRGRSSIDQVLDSQTIERLGDAVCGMHHAQGDDERGFLGLASKPRSTCFGVPATPPANRSLKFLTYSTTQKICSTCFAGSRRCPWPPCGG
jgi:hypothetical protein